MLHRLFSSLDALAEQYGVLKVCKPPLLECFHCNDSLTLSHQVETIGDAYIAATNIRNNQVFETKYLQCLGIMVPSYKMAKLLYCTIGEGLNILALYTLLFF
jgi:hypothetical protein